MGDPWGADIMSMAWVALRVLFGILFVWSGAVKVLDPAAFSATIATYGILPLSMINAAALLMPWMEIIAGMALISSRFAPGGLLVLNGLLLVFVGALLFNVLRGVNTNCGCFSLDGSGTSMRQAILRNIGLLGVGGVLLWQSFREKRQ